MKAMYLSEETAKLYFVKEASAAFAEKPELYSYSKGRIKPGEFLALRWGLGKDCVLVVKLCEDFVPELYQQVIQK